MSKVNEYRNDTSLAEAIPAFKEIYHIKRKLDLLQEII